MSSGDALIFWGVPLPEDWEGDCDAEGDNVEILFHGSSDDPCYAVAIRESIMCVRLGRPRKLIPGPVGNVWHHQLLDFCVENLIDLEEGSGRWWLCSRQG